MKEIYNDITNYLVESGKRIKTKAGQIEDIGVTKKYLTHEDLAIENGLKDIIKNYNSNHQFFAEEENDVFKEADDIWISDPISGTRAFVNGLAHYGMAIAHVHKGKVQFSAVYDPSVDDLYTAYRGEGAFFNNTPLIIKETDEKPKVQFQLASTRKDEKAAVEIFTHLSSKFNLYRTYSSQAINYCHVAKGIYSGMVCFAKDSFADFASSLIIQEAGGVFTNIEGESNIKQSDRTFVAGDKNIHKELLSIVRKVIE